jgi:hypothetical protein
MKQWIISGAMLALISAAGSAMAAEHAGVEMADTASVNGTELVLNGMGLREKGWFDVYVGGLYLEAPTSDAEAVIAGEGVSRVVLTFVRDVGSDKVVGGWDDGFANNNDAATLEAIADRRETFNGFFGDLQDGEIKDDESMVFDMVPGEGTTVTIAGEKKGTIEGDDFAQALRRIWFGPEPPDSNLKEGMLGLD